MKRNDGLFPGPRAFLVSGYDPDQLTALRQFLADIGYGDAPVKPCTAAQIGHPLEKALSEDTEGVPLGQGKLPYALVFSGLSVSDVHAVMDRFSRTGLPRPIFATTTPTNLTFTVKTLLIHLLEEQKMARGAAGAAAE